MQFLEQKAAVFVENCFAVLEFADDFDRADLTTGETGVARVLGHSQLALDPSSFCTSDVTRDALHFGIVETVYYNLVVGPEPAKMCTDGAGRATLRPTQNPPSEGHNNQKNDSANNYSDPFHDDLLSLSEFTTALEAAGWMRLQILMLLFLEVS
jgi:hypothetical protein